MYWFNCYPKYINLVQREINFNNTQKNLKNQSTTVTFYYLSKLVLDYLFSIKFRVIPGMLGGNSFKNYGTLWNIILSIN